MAKVLKPGVDASAVRALTEQRGSDGAAQETA